MENDSSITEDSKIRTRRTRCDSTRNLFDPKNVNSDREKLELAGVIAALKDCSDYEGGINCRVCGKLYKSRVCFTKHIWEHSVYWEIFSGEKNHDRVLSIQAALILWTTRHQNQTLHDLLVTAPHKKEDADSNITTSPLSKVNSSSNKVNITPSKVNMTQRKSEQRGKRKRLISATDLPQAFSPTHSDMGSPAKMSRQC